MKPTLQPPLEWHTEQRKLQDLVPFEYNPRILTEEKKEKLKRSLLKFNLAEIPAINTDNVIIAGHQRIKVLLELGKGEELIDVRVPNRFLSETELKEYNIVSNVPTGYWDLDILDEIFDDIDLEALGLNLDEIQLPDNLIPIDFQHEEERSVDPEPPEDPISALGDVYELHSPQKKIVHRLVCGDAVDKATYQKLLKGQQIDLTATDPPYNVDYQGGKKKKRTAILNDNMDQGPFYEFLSGFYTNVHENGKPGMPMYVFHADTEGINFRLAMISAGFKLSQCLVWKKNSSTISRNDYHWIHEPILYGWKLGGTHPWYSDRKQKTVLEFDRPIRSDEHPTMKPLDLMGYLVMNSSRQKEIVFDGFLGSGTTLIACEKTWRQCRGIEMDPGYMDVSVRRWIKYVMDNDLDHSVVKNGTELKNDEILQYL